MKKKVILLLLVFMCAILSYQVLHSVIVLAQEEASATGFLITEREDLNYYLGPWTWAVEEDGNYWAAPEGTIALIDLRSIPQMSKAGEIPEGVGLFITNRSLDENYFLIGNSLYEELTETQKALWIESTGISSLDSSTLIDVLWETMTVKADPTGETSVKPLRPDPGSGWKIVIGGYIIKEKPFSINSPEWENSLKSIQNDYRKLYWEFYSEESQQHRRVLQSLVEKYGLPYETFIPFDLPKETPLAHSTTFEDDFNRTDANPITGNWYENSGNWEILDNSSHSQAVGMMHYTTALASDAQYSQANILNEYNGVSTRVHATEDTGYVLYLKGDNPKFNKRINGTNTQLSAWTAISANSIIKLVSDADDLHEGFDDEVSIGSITDTSITGNLYVGLYNNGWKKLDNFEGGDLGSFNTCSASEDTNWVVNCWENCTISSDQPAKENIHFQGGGIITLNSTISTNLNNSTIAIDSGCQIHIVGGGKILM